MSLSRRLIFFVIASAIALSASAIVMREGARSSFGQLSTRREIWEKPIAPGLVYRMEYDPARPLVINALRMSLNAPSVQAKPFLAGGTVYEDGPHKGCGTVTEMVSQEHAIGGINGDFFPFTGHPLGLTVRDGELLSLPRPKRASFAWGPHDIAIAMTSFSGTVKNAGGTSAPLGGLNEECQSNGLVLDTPEAGQAWAAKSPSLTAVLQVQDTVFAPSTAFSAKVEILLPDAPKTPIKKGDVMLVAEGDKMPFLAALRPGDIVNISYQTDGLDWEKFEQVIGGGPVLVRGGKVALDEEGFDPTSFVQKTHPRSAVGRTASGEIWWVTVDGRQETGSGLSLPDLAAVMVQLGCVDAMNLDGGGSTTLNVLGLTVNRPSDGSERAVADGVLIYGPSPKLSDVQLEIKSPTRLSLSSSEDLVVREPSGRVVPNREVIWAAQGAAWIDQGGRLRPLKAGAAHVSAAVRGQILTADVQVSP